MRKQFYIIVILLLFNSQLSLADPQPQIKNSYLFPSKVQCVYTHDDILKCQGFNRNYLYEVGVPPKDQSLIERDKLKTYVFSQAETASQDSLQALLTYVDPDNNARITLQTSYFLIEADIKAKTGRNDWKLDESKYWYICDSKNRAGENNCPLINLPFIKS